MTPPGRARLLVAVVVAASALAGCVIEGPPDVPEGRHREAPIAAAGVSRPIEAKGVDVKWEHPETRATRLDTYAATRQALENGVYVVETEVLTLRFRVDEFLPVRLRHDSDLSMENSFNFTYDEPVGHAGRRVTLVLDVDAESFLDVRTFESTSGRVSGSFALAFTGTCREADDGCAAPGEPARVVLDGNFPPKTGH